MLLEFLLGVAAVVGLGRVLYLHPFPVFLACFTLLVLLFLIAIFVRNRFSWSIFFLASTAEALFLFLKGFSYSITVMLFFVVSLVGLILAFVGRGRRRKAKQSEAKVEVVKDEGPKRRGRKPKQ